MIEFTSKTSGGSTGGGGPKPPAPKPPAPAPPKAPRVPDAPDPGHPGVAVPASTKKPHTGPHEDTDGYLVVGLIILVCLLALLMFIMAERGSRRG